MLNSHIKVCIGSNLNENVLYTFFGIVDVSKSIRDEFDRNSDLL